MDLSKAKYILDLTRTVFAIICIFTAYINDKQGKVDARNYNMLWAILLSV